MKRVFSGGGDCVIKVWELSSGYCALSMEGHTKYISSIVVTDGEKQVFSGSFDTTIKAWDPAPASAS